MSIIDELLIMLDGPKPIELDFIKKELTKRTLQTISSTLGRLEAKGWIKITKQENKKLYQITDAGQEEITNNLQEIKTMPKDKWDGSWQIVSFNVPEKIRFARDAFRLKLESLGFGKIQNSLWIGVWDNKKKLDKSIDDLGISKYVIYFSTGKLDEINQKKIARSFEWKWDDLNKEYREYLNQSAFFFLSKKSTYQAKKMVYWYAKILKNDPKFPNEIQPNSYLGIRAFEAYQRIRPYCYK